MLPPTPSPVPSPVPHPAPSPKFTIAICTWNRAALLARTLEQLTRIDAGPIAWEVVVIDNGSPDATPDVLAAFASRLPLRFGRESRLGLAHARNAAVDLARGEFIAWTDDDVLVEPDWLGAYAAALDDDPAAHFLGGPILPWFDGKPPAWLEAALPRIGNAFALLDLGPEPFAFDAARDGEPFRHPYGANFVVRTEAQRRHRFDPRFGRRGRAGALGEEADVLRRIAAEGGAGYWVPRARVRHWIPKHRQTRGYLVQYYRMAGLTQSRRLNLAARHALLFGRPRTDFRALAESLLSHGWHRLRNDDRWLDSLICGAAAWGRLQERAR